MYLIFRGNIGASQEEDGQDVNAPLRRGMVEARVPLRIGFIHVAALGDSCRHQVRPARRNRAKDWVLRHARQHRRPLLFISDLLGVIEGALAMLYICERMCVRLGVR